MSTVAGGATGPGARRRSGPWKVAGASMIGTSVEWYDFGIYATAAALVFPELFFPEVNRALGTLMSFATLFVALSDVRSARSCSGTSATATAVSAP
ncbi:hypothetical protein WDA79_03345 [Streptomyces sp. A475]|uniref:hypothetical protein n=1 Tax=Streptomyces sp. A475 TaxID=3131976 RepID=UPI0030C96884